MTREEMQKFLEEKIYHWVGRNFGTQEAEDPSWDIKSLSSYLSKELTNSRGNARTNTQRESYELTVLVRENTFIIDAVDKIHDMVEASGGRIQRVEDDGIKRLAYTIAGEEKAHYLYLDIELPNGSAPQLSSKLNITDEILRYLLVKKDVRA